MVISALFTSALAFLLLLYIFEFVLQLCDHIFCCQFLLVIFKFLFYKLQLGWFQIHWCCVYCSLLVLYLTFLLECIYFWELPHFYVYSLFDPLCLHFILQCSFKIRVVSVRMVYPVLAPSHDVCAACRMKDCAWRLLRKDLGMRSWQKRRTVPLSKRSFESPLLLAITISSVCYEAKDHV